MKLTEGRNSIVFALSPYIGNVKKIKNLKVFRIDVINFMLTSRR